MSKKRLLSLALLIALIFAGATTVYAAVCYNCKGTGRVICSTCRGTGTIRVGGKEYNCNGCRGYGFFTCAACKGTGER